MQEKPDKWLEWILDRRFGNNTEAMKSAMEILLPVRDRVLQNAGPLEGKVVMDVGSGDGLIAFAALSKVGASGMVIFNDISQDLLAHCRAKAHDIGLLDRCRFLLAPVENLTEIENDTIDVVTIRSVLIYVQDKQRAFDEIYRILKAGGSLSVFEPINRFGHIEAPHIFCGYDVTPVQDIAQKVYALYQRLQPMDTDPMLNFDERDLIASAERAGFKNLRIDLQIQVRPIEATKWDIFTRIAPNPNVPCLEEAIAQTLAPDEAQQLADYLRPLVEEGRGGSRTSRAYLSAEK